MTEALTVLYAVSGTATPDSDYQLLYGSVTIAPGAATATITVTPIDDTLAEGSETVIATLEAESWYEIAPAGQATVTIGDDATDTDAELTITATDANAKETGGDPGQFTVSRTGPTTSALVVGYELSGQATAGSDYGTLSGTVTIPAGAGSVTIPVTPVDDTLAEGDEAVIAGLLAGTGYVRGGPNSAVVFIGDDATDTFPVVTIEATDPSASEAGLDPGEFTLTRTGPLTNELTVQLEQSGTATSDVDYLLSETAPPTLLSAMSGDTITVLFPVGVDRVKLGVLPVADDLVEGDESVGLTVLETPDYKPGPQPTAVVYLDDDDDGAQEGPHVTVVHPINPDFTTGKEGRIMFSTHHDDEYHTVVVTTADNKVAQLQDGKVTISAYLDQTGLAWLQQEKQVKVGRPR